MAANVNGAAEVSLSVFGSLVTQTAAANLPEGVSPDCQDVVFAPGQVASRPPLKAAYADPFPYTPTVVYGKDFVTPTGDVQKLYLCSDGILYVEDFTNAPGTRTPLITSTPGSFAKSITAFGREYLAISDKLHGADIPLQWDGTDLDRVTQDGPGAPPSVANLALPSVAMVATGAAAPLTVTSIDTTDFVDDDMGGGYYTTLTFILAAGGLGLAVSEILTVAGNAEASFNAPWIVDQIVSDTKIICSAFFPSVLSGAGGTATPTGGVTAIRSGNVVTIKTAADHQLKVGYQAQIAGLPASAIGGGVSSIKISNADLPGIALVTTVSAHGLPPGSFVTIAGVTPVVGPNIATISRQGGLVTVITATAHNLVPGASFTITGVTNTSFNTSGSVFSIVSPTGFTFAQADSDAVDATGHINLNWPIPATSTPQYFEVLAAPTPTTFQVSMHYGDGTWTTGVISFAWNGKFYVTSVPSTTTFTYKHNGPNATSATVGSVTPFGQISPGVHQLRLSYLTRSGYVTRPSPPVSFTAPGGQYASLTDIAIGPANVIGRILQFTGAAGDLFFYIPVPVQVNGQLISTATQISDNTTTSVVIDFADSALFAATGTSKDGNDLASQIVLDGALGFAAYASRLLTMGQRSTVQNILNMGFDGGYLPSKTTIPTGWTPTNTGGSLVTTGRWGGAWKIVSVVGGAQYGNLSQSFYQDAYGAPIALPNTLYRFRCWCKLNAASAGLNVVAKISGTGFSATATLSGANMTTVGSWLEMVFSAKTPNAVPSDLALTVYATAATATVTLDEMSVIYDSTPYDDALIKASYVNSPEGFDGVSGVFGSSEDSRKVMVYGIVRDTFYFITQDPKGQLHEVNDNETTEPSGWKVRQVATKCGALSAFCLADGEEWFMWASASGARIFGGEGPRKISQEIQPDWATINKAAQLSIWAVNDEDARCVYFGLPTGAATAPNLIYPMSYIALDSAAEIASAEPVHVSSLGHLAATDNARKWTRFNMTMNGAAMMQGASGKLELTLFGGNGQAPGVAPGYGNVYTLEGAALLDADYGEVLPWYVTYFFVRPETEQALQLGSHRKMVAYYAMTISGGGFITVTPYANALYNPWPLTVTRALEAQPKFDFEWTGGQAAGQRMAFKIAWSGVGSGFVLQRIVVSIRPDSHAPVRGSST